MLTKSLPSRNVLPSNPCPVCRQELSWTRDWGQNYSRQERVSKRRRPETRRSHWVGSEKQQRNPSPPPPDYSLERDWWRTGSKWRRVGGKSQTGLASLQLWVCPDCDKQLQRPQKRHEMETLIHAFRQHLCALPVLTALRAWFTVICELTCRGTFGCWPVAVWADVTPAGGEQADTAVEHAGRGLLKSGPGTIAPRGAEEGLTMVTPLPAWVHRLMGTLGWVFPDAVLMGENVKENGGR